MARSGSCSPWVSGDEIRNLPTIQAAIAKANTPQKTSGITLSDDQITAVCAETAAAATEVLYSLSGKVLTGICGPVTIRPLARPRNVDQRPWTAGAFGTGATYGSVMWYGVGFAGPVSNFGISDPPELPLPDYPVNTIVEVKIDGVVIPPTEYELRDHRLLVRLRPTPSYTPTERYGWPTAAIQDLPDTELGTFSVTYLFGQDPGSMGRLACKKLAEYLALPQFGDSTHYPQRVTSFTRQGVSAMVVDVMDVLSKKALGIYEVDSWLLSVNPQKATRQSAVWSPDVAKSRRQQFPSPSR